MSLASVNCWHITGFTASHSKKDVTPKLLKNAVSNACFSWWTLIWGEVWWQTLVCTCSRRTISLSTCDSANSKSCVKQVVSCLLSDICEVLQVNNKIRWMNKSISKISQQNEVPNFFEFKTPSHSGLQLGITTPVAGLHVKHFGTSSR